MEKKENPAATIKGAGQFYYRANPMETSPAAAQMFYGQGATGRSPVKDSQGFYFRTADKPEIDTGNA